MARETAKVEEHLAHLPVAVLCTMHYARTGSNKESYDAQWHHLMGQYVYTSN